MNFIHLFHYLTMRFSNTPMVLEQALLHCYRKFPPHAMQPTSRFVLPRSPVHGSQPPAQPDTFINSNHSSLIYLYLSHIPMSDAAPVRASQHRHPRLSRIFIHFPSKRKKHMTSSDVLMTLKRHPSLCTVGSTQQGTSPLPLKLLYKPIILHFIFQFRLETINPLPPQQ